MSDCCSGTDCALRPDQARQRTTLRLVLVINVVMFAVITAAALYAGSAALLSDGMDNLGDALTYGLSLWAVARGSRAKARVALFKGVLILLGACGVIAQIVHKLLVPEPPVFVLMGGFSLLSLAANGICLWLLWRHRDEDINMRSVWECSRNDVATDLSVLLAAAGVWLTASGWPDVALASALALLLLRSAWRVISSARRELAA